MLEKESTVMRFHTPVIIVGQGEVNEKWLIKLAAACPVVALDGALQITAALGLKADIVIGDCDSVDKTLIDEAADQIVHITEQDSTDFEKALYSIEAPLFLCFGLFGKRFDHSFANMHIVKKYHDQTHLIVINADEVITCHKGDLLAETKTDSRVSILPLEPITFATTTGLLWPFDGQELAIGTLVSSSNQAASDQLKLAPISSDQDKSYLLCRDLGLLKSILQPYVQEDEGAIS